MSPYASPNDHRQYHYLQLANRLRVLLICDPETDKSAGSLAVNTGHFDDPADRQGMAHFCEAESSVKGEGGVDESYFRARRVIQGLESADKQR